MYMNNFIYMHTHGVCEGVSQAHGVCVFVFMYVQLYAHIYTNIHIYIHPTEVREGVSQAHGVCVYILYIYIYVYVSIHIY